MGLGLALLVFGSLFALLASLPFWPALEELIRRRDAGPLVVHGDADVRIRHLAEGFRNFLGERMATVLEQCRREHCDLEGTLEEGTEYSAFGRQPGSEPRSLNLRPNPCARLILSAGSLRLPPNTVCSREVYVAGSLDGGEAGVYRAILADGSVRLGAGSASLRWVDAGDTIRAGSGSRLFGRASAGEMISLEGGCRFERLHAPVLEFGPAPEAVTEMMELREITAGEVPGRIEVDSGRWLVRGPFLLEAGRVIAADLVATGNVVIGRGACVRGSIKSHRNLTLAPFACVDGALTSRRNIVLGENCRVGGPVISEACVRVGGGASIGACDRPTTVTARRIRFALGSRTHGSVWAHEQGEVDGGSEGPAGRVRSKAGAPGVGTWSPLDKSLERLRYLGHEGGFVPRHRALLFSPHNPAKFIPAFALSAAGAALWILSRNYVSGFWMAAFKFWIEVLGLPGTVSAYTYPLFGAYTIRVPYLDLPSSLPGPTAWWIGAAVTTMLVLWSSLAPRRNLPLIFLLRMLALFQASAQLFFALWGNAFPYDIAHYVHGMLIASWMLVLLVPLVLGFVYYIFDFTLGRKIALTLVIMGHQALFIPMQYMMQAYLVYRGSLLILPLLFMTLSLPLNVAIFIALFSWGFSWENRLQQEAVQWKVRRHGY